MKIYNSLLNYFTDLIDKKWFEKIYYVTTSILVFGFLFESATDHLLETLLGKDILYQLFFFFAVNSVVALSISVAIPRSFIKYIFFIFRYTIGKFWKNKEKRELVVDNVLDFLVVIHFIANAIYIFLFVFNLLIAKLTGGAIFGINMFLSIAILMLTTMMIFIGYCSYQTPDSISSSEVNSY